MERLGSQDEDLVTDGKEMSLWEHLNELRVVIIRSLAAILILFVLGLVFSDQLFDLLKQPLLRALPSGSQGLHFTGPMDVFVASLKVSFLASVVLGCPIWLYQFWTFLKPGLYPSERKLVLPFATASIALFFTGVSFCYFVILPMTLKFLIGYGMEVGTPIITINDYLSMLLMLIFGFGIIFETPVILVLLAALDLLSAKALAEIRSFVLVAILIVSAVLTPPDPLSQIAMAIPVYAMYEISIIIIRLMERRSQRKAANGVAQI